MTRNILIAVDNTDVSVFLRSQTRVVLVGRNAPVDRRFRVLPADVGQRVRMGNKEYLSRGDKDNETRGKEKSRSPSRTRTSCRTVNVFLRQAIRSI